MTDKPRGFQFSLASLFALLSLASVFLALSRYFPISVTIGAGPVMAAAFAAAALSRRAAIYAGGIACGVVWTTGAFPFAVTSEIGDLEFFAPILVGCFAGGMLLGGLVGLAVNELFFQPRRKKHRRRRRRRDEWARFMQRLLE